MNYSDFFSLDDNVTYLNCAYMSPLLKKVEAAGIEGIIQKRNPQYLSGEGFFNNVSTLKSEFAKLINCDEAKRIAIIPSVSYGIANAAKNITINAGENIVVLNEQFPSNYYSWDRLAKENNAVLKVAKPSGTNKGESWNKDLLNKIDNRTKIVAICQVHWADGTLFELKSIREKATQVGAKLIIDGTQSVGAYPFDIKEIQPDALICAGYKWLMGPYSIGLAYYNESFEEGIPIEENWITRSESENFGKLVNYNSNFQSGSAKYSVGEHSNFILVPMMIEAIKQLNEWKPSTIQQHCRSISEKNIIQLRNSGFIIEESNYRSNHLFGIGLPKEKNIETVMQNLRNENIIVSQRGNFIRIAPHLYNTESDFEKLTTCLRFL